MKVYFYDAGGKGVTDISALDLSSENAAEAGWGGLTRFSGNIADVVSELSSEG
ncbi:MAG TPA: hypothetical protein VFH83_02860 [Spirochaetia bacterium]|nr:hypothetical protein [Spirochaetia bacterium]